VGIRVFRPFPEKKEVVAAYRNAKAIILFEKSVSYGYEGGLCSDLKAAFYGSGVSAVIHDYVAGLGGRDVKARELVEAVKSSLARIADGERELNTTWLNCHTE
jgi:pyruvate/2-oxoacid:ferredoxin oxidoreductase alpha subunit